MKKVSLFLAIIMAFCGTSLFAQRSAQNSPINQQVIQHFLGHRDNDGLMPGTADYYRIEGSSVVEYHVDYTFDENDFYMAEKLTQKMDGGVWTNAYYETFEYDFSGNVIEDLLMEWNGNEWVNSYYTTSTYQSSDLADEVICQYWNGSEWVNDIKMVYDVSGYSITTLTYIWDDGWKVSELQTYSVGLTGIEILIQYMQGGAWQNDEKMTIYVDLTTVQIQAILTEEWENSAWENDEYTTYSYNEDGTLSSILYQNWEGNWVDENRVDYENENGNATHAICFEWNGNAWIDDNEDVEMQYHYAGASEEFDDVHEVIMKYVDVDAVSEQHANVFSVFPNPASESISISGEGFQKAEIYNAVGQKVMETTMNAINVSDLQSGIYMLKVYDANGSVEAQSFVVK